MEESVPVDDGKIPPRKRDIKLAKKEDFKLRTVSEVKDDVKPDEPIPQKPRTSAPTRQLLVQRRLRLNIPSTKSHLQKPKRNNALKPLPA